ncbi:MAG: hypothetical protein HYX48_06470 [Chlamydiales bacterium]|nr:hypothetical protein [Chlamydiales bacterium]
MRKLVSVFLLVCGGVFAAPAEIKTADEITYDRLVKMGDDSGSTDHVLHFKKLFKELDVRTFLEFGVSYASKYFLDSCDDVITVEFITYGYGPERIKNFLKLYENYENWMPVIFFTGYQGDMGWAPYKHRGTEGVYKATSYQSATHQSYAVFDSFYQTELNLFILKLTQTNPIDVAFINEGIIIRGDLVQLLFGKVPVIFAHDTSCRAAGNTEDVYGYSRIRVPEDYEEIYFPHGSGTTAWIVKKEPFKNLILSLKKYAKGL